MLCNNYQEGSAVVTENTVAGAKLLQQLSVCRSAVGTLLFHLKTFIFKPARNIWTGDIVKATSVNCTRPSGIEE